jgi:DNA-binding SARP family transcriptional activator
MLPPEGERKHMNDGRLAACPSPLSTLGPHGGAPVDVRCFGGFEIRVAGRPLDWSGIRPRVRALLRFLAMHTGQPVHRERIVAELWPELSGRAGINNLQVAVSTLRTFLEPGVARGASRFIPRDGESYRLALGDGGRSDLLRFESAIAAGRHALAAGRAAAAAGALRDALSQYGGDLLPEDGPAEWVVAERSRYRLRAAEAAALLARLEFDAGDWRGAIQVARRTLELDACCDDGWRLLIRAQQRAGDTMAASHTWRSYERMLQSLGVGAPPMTAIEPMPRPGQRPLTVA